MGSHRIMLYPHNSEHVDDPVKSLFQLFQRSSTITVLIGKLNRNVLIMQLMLVNFSFCRRAGSFEVFPPPPFGNSDPDVNSFHTCHFRVCWHVILENYPRSVILSTHASFPYLNLYNRNLTN